MAEMNGDPEYNSKTIATFASSVLLSVILLAYIYLYFIFKVTFKQPL